MTTTEEGFEPREWLAHGLRYSNGKRYNALELLGPGGERSTVGFWGTKDRSQHGSFQPGCVYTIETNADGTRAVLTGAKFKARWHDQEEAEVILARSTAYAAEVRLDALEKSSGEALAAFTKALAPIRKAYISTSPAGRVGIEMALIRALRGMAG